MNFQDVKMCSPKEFPLGLDASTEEEYSSQSSLLQDFTSIPTIDKAWTFTSDGGSQGMFDKPTESPSQQEEKIHIILSYFKRKYK